MRVVGLITIAVATAAAVTMARDVAWPAPARDAAAQARAGALKRAEREILLSEIGRPHPASDTRIETRIVRLPPGVRALPPRDEPPVTGLGGVVIAPFNRRPSDPRGDVLPGSTQSEVSLATWHGQVLAAWNDGEVLGGHTGLLGWGMSLDGGRSWVDGGGPPVGGDVVSWTSDPVVAVDDRTGWFYLAGLAVGTGPSNAIGLVRGRVLGGTLVWDPPRAARTVRDTVLDKPWLAVDPVTGTVHLSYTTFYRDGDEPLDRIEHQSSPDGGLTWSPEHRINRDEEEGLVQGSRVAVDGDGRLIVLYRALDTDPAAGGVDRIRVRTSDDNGRTFSPSYEVAAAYTNYGSGAPGFDRGFAPTFPSLAVDRSGGPHRGRMYVAWNESLDFYDDPLGTLGDMFESEPNGDPESATPLTIGTSLRASIAASGDIDRFRFSGAAGQTLVVLLDSLSTAGGLALALEHGGGGSPVAFSSVIPVRPRLLVYTLPETGEYRLRVSLTGDSAGAYTLRTGWAVRDQERGRDHRDVFVAWSDDGAVWSEPRRVNDDAPRFENWLPEVAVDDFGRAFVAWYDWRDSPPGELFASHVYLARSLDGGATWHGLGPVSTAPTVWEGVSTNLIPSQGDYIGIVADSANVLPAWADGRSGTPDIFLAIWPVGQDAPLFEAVSAEADTAQVRVVWRGQTEGMAALVERSQDGGPWVPLHAGRSDRARRIVTDDPARPPGAYLRYRLSVERDDGARVVATTELVVPGGPAATLELSRIVGPSGAGGVTVAFRLAGAAPGEVELHDLAGRRLARVTVRGGLDGRGTVELAPPGRLAPGVFFVRLRQAGGERRLKAVVVR